MNEVKWWQFWHPGSGAIGGLIMGALVIFLFWLHSSV